MKASLILTIFLLFSQSLFGAETLIPLTVEGRSTSDSPPKARAAALKDALEKAALQEIGNLIGPAKLEKNRPSINSKILSQTGRYIVNYKAAEPTVKEGETTVVVNLKLDPQSLKALLSKEGLLYQSEGPATVLPLIVLNEKKVGGRSFRWWIEEASPQNSFLREEMKSLIKQFDTTFRGRGFYFIDPVNMHYVQMVPDVHREANLTLDDILWFGSFFKAQMVIFGEGNLEPSSVNPRATRLEMRLTAYHTANGRVVGELTRSFEGLPMEWDLGVRQIMKKGGEETVKDLSAQVFEEWARGTFGAILLKIRVSGDVDYQDLEAFKKQVGLKIADVKTLRERRLESDAATFEVDTAGGMANLVKRLEQTPFEGYQATVSGVESSQLDLRWKKK